MDKRYRLTKALFVFALLLFSALFPWPTYGQGENNQGQRREVPSLDLILMVDESETMWNKTDTEGVRVNTVNFLIDLLNSEQSGSAHRLAIIAFGTGPRVIPYTLLDGQTAAETLKEQYATVHKQIEARKDLEYTDINKALQAALELLEQDKNPSQKPAVILISDGQPTNPQVSEKIGRESVVAYLNETQNLIEQLGEYQLLDSTCPSPAGAPLYTVGLGVDKLETASSPEFITLYREFWQSGSGRTSGYYREAQRLQQMQGIGTYIFSELLCTPATPASAVRANQVLEYQVFSSYFQIFFTISGKENPELTAKIYRPQQNGKPGEVAVSKEDEGVTWQGGSDYEVWGVRFTEPWAGTWRVVLEGEGRAEFSYVFFPNVTIDLIEPNRGFLPVERPFTIQAGIKDENGQSVDVPVRDFQVEIEGQDFRKQLSLEKEGNVYVTELEALPKTGEYSLTLNATLPDGTPLFEHKFVTLISAPWVEVTDPGQDASYQPGEAISLEAKIHSGGAASLEDAKLVATLLRDDEPIQAIELSRAETLSQAGENVAVFTGEFQPIKDTGEYAVQAKLMTILPGGRIFDHETAPIPLSIVLPPTPTSSPSPTATPTPTSTPSPTATAAPAALVAPSPSPTSAPTPTPAPVSWLATVTSLPFLPLMLALLALLLLLVLLAMLWRRRRPAVPNGLKLLAALMRTRRESGEAPYLLILGSGASVALGSQSMKTIVEAVADGPDLEKFYKTLDGFSPVERQVILNKQFEQARISSGYRHLAELVKQGFFDLIFTTNLDPFLENSLATNNANTAEFQVLVAGSQDSAETLKMIKKPQPRVKIVKLHGDIQARKFAFTASEISLIGSESESILHGYFNQDLIVVDPGLRDHDVDQAIAREGGSIWYIGQTPPTADTSLHRAMKFRSTEANVISGEFGMFDRFFEALHRELRRS